MSIELDELSYDELLDLNDRVIERLKFLEATDTINAMMKLNVGTKVCFDSSRHGTQVGIIIKFNQKTVAVLTDDGRRWKVAPQMLSPIVQDAAGNTNVIDLKKKKFDPS